MSVDILLLDSKSMYDRFIDYDDSHLHFQATLMPSPEECFRLGKIIIGGYGVMTKLHNLNANEAGHMLVSCHSNSQRRSHRVGYNTRDLNFISRLEKKEKRSHFRQTFTITRILKERERVSLPDFTD
ncbi:hypothetical protein HID58_014538, partial [Brassica napus]